MFSFTFVPFQHGSSAQVQNKNTMGQFCFVPRPYSCCNNMQGVLKTPKPYWEKELAFLGSTNQHIWDVPALKGSSFASTQQCQCTDISVNLGKIVPRLLSRVKQLSYSSVSTIIFGLGGSVVLCCTSAYLCKVSSVLQQILLNVPEA